jgi:AcrR family transcriptional regulator
MKTLARSPSPSADARLLAIAAQQLKAHGAKAVTVVGVAELAGMTHANVYRYFPSKAALIDAIAARWLKNLEATIAEIADAPDPADDKLERLIQAQARAQRDLLANDRHLFDVYCSATENNRALVRKHRARLRELVERVLDEGMATAKFDPRDRDRALVEHPFAGAGPRPRVHRRCRLPVRQPGCGPPRCGDPSRHPRSAARRNDPGDPARPRERLSLGLVTKRSFCNKEGEGGIGQLSGSKPSGSSIRRFSDRCRDGLTPCTLTILRLEAPSCLCVNSASRRGWTPL